MEKNKKTLAVIGLCVPILAALITATATIIAPLISLRASHHNQEEITFETSSAISHKEDIDNYSICIESTQSNTSPIVTFDSSAQTTQPPKKALELIATNWKNKSTYQEFPNRDGKSFIMFGKDYSPGFTLLMGASYNMWGNGEQYVTFNVSDISAQYSFIDFFFVYVDEYSSDDIILKIYLDKTTEMIPDYTYTVSPTLAPSRISVNISGTSSMTVFVSNQGGSSNMIGFADISFR